MQRKTASGPEEQSFQFTSARTFRSGSLGRAGIPAPLQPCRLPLLNLSIFLYTDFCSMLLTAAPKLSNILPFHAGVAQR